MTAVDQTGSGQADSAVRTGFEPAVLAGQADLVESNGSGFPAEQRGWTEPAVPVALTVPIVPAVPAEC